MDGSIPAAVAFVPIKWLMDMWGEGSLGGWLLISSMVAVILLTKAIALLRKKRYILALTWSGLTLVAIFMVTWLLAAQNYMPIWVPLMLLIAGVLIFVSGAVMDVVAFPRRRARGSQPQQEELEPPA